MSASSMETEPVEGEPVEAAPVESGPVPTESKTTESSQTDPEKPSKKLQVFKVASDKTKTGIHGVTLQAFMGFQNPNKRRIKNLTPKDHEAWLDWLLYVVQKHMDSTVEYLTPKELKKVIDRARPNLGRKYSPDPIIDGDSPECLKWDTTQVGDWLESIDLPHLRNVFEENFITGRRLILIDCATLNQMGRSDLQEMATVTKAIRELLGISYPNQSRPIMRISPFESFLRQKVYTGKKYDELTFVQYCEQQGFNYEYLMTNNKNAEIVCTTEVSITTPENVVKDDDSEEDGEDYSLENAPSVEFLVRKALTRNKTINQILEDILENLFLPPRDRKYGKDVWGSLRRGIGEGYDDLHLHYTPEKLEFASGIAHHVLDELYKTVDVLNDISSLQKHITDEITEDDMKMFAGAGNELLESAAPIAALLALGELDLETIFKQEPEFEEFVDSVIAEAEQRTNELMPTASAFVDDVIEEAWKIIPALDLRGLEPHLEQSLLEIANDILTGLVDKKSDVIQQIMGSAATAARKQSLVRVYGMKSSAALLRNTSPYDPKVRFEAIVGKVGTNKQAEGGSDIKEEDGEGELLPTDEGEGDGEGEFAEGDETWREETEEIQNEQSSAEENLDDGNQPKRQSNAKKSITKETEENAKKRKSNAVGDGEEEAGDEGEEYEEANVTVEALTVSHALPKKNLKPEKPQFTQLPAAVQVRLSPVSTPKYPPVPRSPLTVKPWSSESTPPVSAEGMPPRTPVKKAFQEESEEQIDIKRGANLIVKAAVYRDRPGRVPPKMAAAPMTKESLPKDVAHHTRLSTEPNTGTEEHHISMKDPHKVRRSKNEKPTYQYDDQGGGLHYSSQSFHPNGLEEQKKGNRSQKTGRGSFQRNRRSKEYDNKRMSKDSGKKKEKEKKESLKKQLIPKEPMVSPHDSKTLLNKDFSIVQDPETSSMAEETQTLPNEQPSVQISNTSTAMKIWDQMRDQYNQNKAEKDLPEKKETQEQLRRIASAPHRKPPNQRPDLTVKVDPEKIKRMRELRSFQVDDWAQKQQNLDNDEEKARVVRTTADKVVMDICTMALTHLLLEAEAGRNTQKIVEALKSLKNDASGKKTPWDIMLWSSSNQELKKTKHHKSRNRFQATQTDPRGDLKLGMEMLKEQAEAMLVRKVTTALSQIPSYSHSVLQS